MRHTTRQAAKSVVVYCRVSTSGQAADGVSLEAQQSRASQWAQTQGYTLSGVHVDAGLSGGRADNRPALQAALTQVCRDKGVLVVYSLSRLARSVPDTLTIAARLDKAGADLVSLSESIDTTSAAGKMTFRMLAVLAEFERDLASERTAGALAHKASKGERVSRFAPMGRRFDGDAVVVDEAERETVAYVGKLRDEGLSYRAIVERLNAESVPCRGARWHLSTVHAILAA